MIACQPEYGLRQSTFLIQKMDCPCEEQLIRMQLADCPGIASLQFDIPGRRLDVYHTGGIEAIHQKINTLQLDASLLESCAAETPAPSDGDSAERKLLWQLLGINCFFFALELLTGFFAGSMGLVADSLDMLADSIVYGLALLAVGTTARRKKNVARASGYLQLALAMLGLFEVIRRVLGFGDVPVFQTMVVISTLALLGNATCLYLLHGSKNTDTHMRASMLFTANDVIINLGVIIAGALVYLTNSRIPDLIVGALVFCLVARGAYRILRLAQ